MDPLDHGRADLDGLTCAVCEGPVPAESIHLLAHRDALAFVQVECAACRSTTLAFVLEGSNAGVARPAVTADDVLDMHEFLRGWHGNLTDLVDQTAAGSDGR